MVIGVMNWLSYSSCMPTHNATHCKTVLLGLTQRRVPRLFGSLCAARALAGSLISRTAPQALMLLSYSPQCTNVDIRGAMRTKNAFVWLGTARCVVCFFLNTFPLQCLPLRLGPCTFSYRIWTWYFL